MELFCQTLHGSVQLLANFKYAEYSFSCCVNPLQHPCFDGNIHHLTALVTALCNTCGGLVYLEAPKEILREKVQFGVFKSYLTQVLSVAGVPETAVEVSELKSCDTCFFAMILAKHSKHVLPYNFDGNEIELRLDVHGRLHHENATEHGEQVLEISAEQGPSIDLLTEEQQRTGQDEFDFDRRLAANRTYSMNQPIKFRALTWDQNKRNWEEILNESQDSHDDWITSCDVWKPTLPMKITPDADSLKYLFPSDTDCINTLTKLQTKTPGFAIASKTWTSFLPKLDSLASPPSHLGDIISVSTENDVCLWVIVSNSSQQTIQEQLQYMLTVGRTIKYQIVTRNRDVPNFIIHCFLFSTYNADNKLIENNLNPLGINDTLDLLYQSLQQKGNFAELQRGIALLLLSQESHITTCVGHQRSVKLSARQALTLLKVKRRRVSYVSSPPGTGKTLCGLSLYREFGKDRSVYICPTEPLIQYLRYNGCQATLIRDDEQLYREIEHGTFDNKMCVIIDESHHLRCSREGLEQLFSILKEQRMFLFVFADNEYQSFDRQNQQQIEQIIHDLSRKVLGYYPEKHTFTEVYRNTRKVVSFLQHAIEDIEPSFQDITCANSNDGDGIHCLAMPIESLWDPDPQNGLVQYLRPLLIITGPKTDSTFLVTEVAVLFDAGYTNSQLDCIKNILETHFPRVSTQGSAEFPRKGITVDKIENFVGLDAALCIFLQSAANHPEAMIENYRYRVFLASRATQRAVFLVPEINSAVVQRMKFDHIQASKVT